MLLLLSRKRKLSGYILEFPYNFIETFQHLTIQIFFKITYSGVLTYLKLSFCVENFLKSSAYVINIIRIFSNICYRIFKNRDHFSFRKKPGTLASG